MPDWLKKGLLCTLFSLGCGLMLAIFPNVKTGVNFLFSILALVIAIFYFKQFTSLRSRIVFGVMSLLFFLIFTIVIAVVLYARAHPMTTT
ncbi:hypothetical protein [Paenibacillus sp. CF384]|uniref:hypothetical protein n=1 Tax=Paenibacillus sp. CF384 TaxID=1884382 RepID=UPI00089AD098|nr:hypothetical protein [Paenibacillus sp. CF384]SDW59606.1 hypothetical protein SAMN05518855_1003244 [Paenibacillus sp. CF384]